MNGEKREELLKNLLETFSSPHRSDWERVAATITIKIRWFGLIAGFAIANLLPHNSGDLVMLNCLLGLGLIFTVIDTYCVYRDRIFFLSQKPLLLSLLETIFIGLLCFFDAGINSPFRYYYLLSLIVCAIRYPREVPYAACLSHTLSLVILFSITLRMTPEKVEMTTFLFMIVVMLWVTWAASTLAGHLREAWQKTIRLNDQLQQQQVLLEQRIQERTTELQEAQAHMLHQEKMAAFGLLAAGIAHEVGNPLTSISSLVQLVQRKATEPYIQEKLSLVGGQLDRISLTLKELVTFSRPASSERVWTDLESIAKEALDIAKYYKRVQGKQVRMEFLLPLPPVHIIRDRITQALLNLVLNAIDATEKGGEIVISGASQDEEITLEVRDNGCGISSSQSAKLFQPYFTTKGHGTGLGLFVTRQLVEEHSGRVSFESEPGLGSKFRIHLPANTKGVKEQVGG